MITLCVRTVNLAIAIVSAGIITAKCFAKNKFHPKMFFTKNTIYNGGVSN